MSTAAYIPWQTGFRSLRTGARVRLTLALLACSLLLLTTHDTRGESPYPADPKVVAQLKALQPGQSILLPARYVSFEGQEISGTGRQGPYSRDYTNAMVYAPDRQTALYAGGNHGMGRTNDVWEFHLGSGTWHQLHPSDGGDHARFKYALMFYPRILMKNPNPELTDKQKQEVEECRKWWQENVIQHEGNFVMRETHAPLLVGHTWDTLMYDEVNKRMVQGQGANCANVPFLGEIYNGRSAADMAATHGKRADGTPWRRPWTFDPVTRKWSPYAHQSDIPNLQGMAGSLLYIPDLEGAIWYYSGQNTPGAPHRMSFWDLKKDTWTDLKPNGGKALLTLAAREKQAPVSEQQMVYATKHKKIVAAGPGHDTFIYDFKTNNWSRANEECPFNAHDAHTVFAYDSVADVCLLAAPKKGQAAAYDLKTNKWTMIEPNGPSAPVPQYNVGRGYYDPTYNVFVVHSANTDKIWIYRHAGGTATASK